MMNNRANDPRLQARGQMQGRGIPPRAPPMQRGGPVRPPLMTGRGVPQPPRIAGRPPMMVRRDTRGAPTMIRGGRQFPMRARAGPPAQRAPFQGRACSGLPLVNRMPQGRPGPPAQRAPFQGRANGLPLASRMPPGRTLPSMPGRIPPPPPPPPPRQPLLPNVPPPPSVPRNFPAGVPRPMPPPATAASYPPAQHLPASTASASSKAIATATATAAAAAATTTTTTTTPATTTTSYSKEQLDEAWTEHTAPNGMKYYYNSLSQESTYLKPEALQKKKNVAAATTNVQQREWKEYTDQTTGKKYYSDGVTTTWEKPAALTASILEDISSKDEEGVSEPVRKKKRSAKKETEFNSKEEAIAAFKGLLLAKDISPILKWNEVVKICSSDAARWEACEDVLTTGERKQALAEYQTKRANELRTIERQERVRAKEVFTQLLTDVLPSVHGFSALTSRFPDIRVSLSKDDRFHVVADEATRESLFLDFCEEFRKRDERKKRNKRREAQDAFILFLKEKQEDGLLTYASTWSSFASSLNEADEANSRFVVSQELSDEDRQLYFADFVIELQATEDDKRRRIRDARQRAEQEQREAFHGFLSSLAANGKLLPASRWRNVEELVSSDPSFGPVRDQDREAPREIFEEFANEWNNAYRSERTFLSQLVYPSSKTDEVVKPDTSYEEFTRALLDRASDSPDMYAETRAIINRGSPVSSARLYFNELSMRARGVTGPAFVRRGSALRRKDYDSSEDEGEIIEDGEVADMISH